jgi:type IV fimbrial biogenesis protein FimT
VLVSDPRRRAGFTLIEMMVVVSVMAVMLTLAMPSLSALLEAQRLRSAAFDLVGDLTTARGEALNRRQSVSISPVSSGDWTSGWRVTEGDEVIRQRSPLGGSLSVSGAPGSIAYDPNGRLAAADGFIRIEIGSSALTDETRLRCISVDPLGRVRSDIGECP